MAEKWVARTQLNCDGPAKISSKQDSSQQRCPRKGVKGGARQEQDAKSARKGVCAAESKGLHRIYDRLHWNQLHHRIQDEERDNQDAEDATQPEQGRRLSLIHI